MDAQITNILSSSMKESQMRVKSMAALVSLLHSGHNLVKKRPPTSWLMMNCRPGKEEGCFLTLSTNILEWESLATDNTRPSLWSYWHKMSLKWELAGRNLSLSSMWHKSAMCERTETKGWVEALQIVSSTSTSPKGNNFKRKSNTEGSLITDTWFY